MKTNCRKSDGWRVTSDKANNITCALISRHASRVTRHASAFTLIELLTVMAIMGVLAALILPVMHAVKIHQYIYNTQAEMAQLETAIDRYKAAYGFYPPSPTPPPTPGNQSSLVNQLYYELVGTTYTNNIYTTLDGSASIDADQVSTAFPNVGGFMNCTKPGAGEDSAAARNFLPDLKPKQFTAISNNVLVNILIGSVGGPSVQYQLLGQQDINPWRYVCPGINNPGSYDLWMELVFAPGQTNLICNWTKQVQINSPWP